MPRTGLHRSSVGERRIPANHSWVNEYCWYLDLALLPTNDLFAPVVQLGTGESSRLWCLFHPLNVHGDARIMGLPQSFVYATVVAVRREMFRFTRSMPQRSNMFRFDVLPTRQWQMLTSF